MKIISLEGIDKCGKHSQSNRLTYGLLKEGYSVFKSEFHRYDTPTGKLIMDWLTGKWDVDQKTIELIMTADKQAQQNWINMLEHQGYDVLILDRYMLSQAAYAVASGLDGRWVIDLQKYMRKPDVDIVIDIPAEVSMTRKGKHNNGVNDRYESDLKLLSAVRDNYKGFSTTYSAPIKWIVDGIDTIDAIHETIYKKVRDYLDETTREVRTGYELPGHTTQTREN